MPRFTRLLLAFVLVLLCPHQHSFAATNAKVGGEMTALLRCYVSYADQIQVIDAYPQTSAYENKTVDIGGRFTFKAVVIGKSTKIDHIALYAYFQASPKDLPIHEAIYHGPFSLNQVPSLLTPYNHLYAGEVERELKYHCKLSKVKL